MFEYEEEPLSKEEMLQEIEENNWNDELNDESSYEELKESYDEMIEEFDDSYNPMYPNGRDYDAEDEDGL